MEREWWKNRPILSDYFYFAQPLPTSGGLFYTMRQENPPWGNDAGFGSQLDTLYMLTRGDKFVSTFLYKFSSIYPLTSRQIQTLSGLICVQYKSKWEKLYVVRNAEYNPIENYDMTEDEDYGHTDTTNRVLTRDNDLYGFNSVTPSHSSKNTDTEIDNTLARVGDRTLTRHGNVGVTTSQQMIQSEIGLWNNWEFFDNVFKDVDTILTMPIY